MKILSLLLPYLLMTVPAAAAEARYVDAETYFTSTEMGRLLLPSGFKSMREKLDDQFHAVCADSFCEGVVSNWASLDLICTVDQENHVAGECLWSFAGSFDEVDPTTGKVTVFHENRSCDLGFAGSSAQLAEFLLASAAAKGHAFGLLSTRVPGRTDDLALFDVLNACL